MLRDYVLFTVNGKLYKVSGEEAFLPLSDFLRYELGLTGTKIVCAEGDCGACTVMFNRPQTMAKKFHSLNSCICTTFLMDGCHIVTVECLGTSDHLSEVQEAMINNFGSQCGFCTPGFVMSLSNMFEHKSEPGLQNAKNYLTGNLCRCTGYDPILKAVLSVDKNKVRPFRELYEFEPLTKVLNEDTLTSVKITLGNREYYAPKDLQSAVDYKNANPHTRIFSGGTDLGVQINKGRFKGQGYMSLHLIKDLYKIELEGDWIRVGAKATINDLQVKLSDVAPEFCEFLNIFASPQIKNVATLVGNLANGSPIADTMPYLLTLDAEVELRGPRGIRKIPLEDFIVDYKKFDMSEQEFIVAIRFKNSTKLNSTLKLYKVSQRRDLDISCVNASFVLREKDNHVDYLRACFGGVGPKAMLLKRLEKELMGKAMDEDLISGAKKIIDEDIHPLSDVRGSKDFRAHLCQDLFEKFVRENFLS